MDQDNSLILPLSAQHPFVNTPNPLVACSLMNSTGYSLKGVLATKSFSCVQLQE